VDSGATHNFISRELVEAMAWGYELSEKLRIRLGDGGQADTKGLCRNLRVTLGGAEFVLNAYLFDLPPGFDGVLGLSWLSLIGEMTVDWKKKTMKFVHQGVPIELVGIKTGGKRKLALREMTTSQSSFPEQRLLLLDASGETKTLVEKQLSKAQQEEMRKLLERFAKVFQKPRGLPPVRRSEHVISAQGVAVDPSKVDSVTSWPVPTNIRGVRGFLGLTRYYRKFVKGYGKIAQPLTELTKKDNFRWTEEAHRAFDTLKICLTHTPVLALPRFDEEFRLECDASGSGIRAILVQNNRPVAYFSKSLSGKNLMKSTYEKELMAVVLAVQHWRPYLLGRHLVVQTDHKSLKQLLQQKVINGNQQDWLAKLLGYNFDIVYKPGKENRRADSLSRRDDDGEINTLVYFPFWADWQAIAAETREDARLKKIVAELQEDPASHPGYSYSQNTLFYGNRLVVAETSGWIPQLLQEFHASPQGGYSGFYKTYRRFAENLYWKGMKGTVQRFVRSCDVCQRQKYLTSSPAGLLQPLPVPERIWDDLSLDFITGLPKLQDFETIMVVVDRLSKYVHFVPLKHPFTARSVAELFVKEIVRLHGVPNSLVSDRDPLFMSQFWQEFFKLQGTKL